MREIKFRAWDKKRKQWVEGDHFAEGHATSSENAAVILTSDEDYEIVEFTGLIDRSGEEIWEGDITDESSVAGVVKMIQGCWCADYVDMEEHQILAKRIVNVIGNIYENPELLDL